jgi:Flp pilus assembly protein TadD
MAASTALRRSVRRIPVLRSLAGRDLETIMNRMTCKEYRSGDVIWRTKVPNDFFVIIHHGEIVLEYRIHGSLIRSIRLSAGDFLLPRSLKIRNPHSMVIMRTVSDARLYILPGQQVKRLWPSGSPTQTHAHLRAPWVWLWYASVALLILFLNWHDMARIASGSLYIASSQLTYPVYDEQRSIELLDYAEAIDQEAVFAYNREGYIWFERDNLHQAERAFRQALHIDQGNAPALNNQAVTYFKTGLLSQAQMYQQKAAQNDPDSAVVKYNYGIVLMNDKENTKALREFKEASFISPTWALPYIQQGYIYLQIGDFVNAERAARHAIKLDSAQQSAHLILAIALHNQGLHQEALAAVENALQMNPDDRACRFYQARILMDLREFDRAFSALNQLLETADDLEEISRIKAEFEAWHRYLQNVSAGIH